MPNWKALGEVPDSEDDDSTFDDLELEPAAKRARREVPRPGARLPEDENRGSLWDVPPSPEQKEEAAGKQYFLHHSVPSPALSPDHSNDSSLRPTAVPRRPDNELYDLSSSIAASQESNDLPDLSTATRIPPLAVRDAGSQDLGVGDSSNDGLRPATSDDGHRLVVEIFSESGEAQQRDTNLRGPRSLRPRKPIQQHPYLLENAHYAQVMKSHGMKPVKVTLDSQVAELSGEKESQEKDFEPDASQDDSAQALQRHGFQTTRLSGVDDDEDELALSPSSPRTTSSSRFRRHTSSQQSAIYRTDQTSPLGADELPSLDDLFQNFGHTAGPARRRLDSPEIEPPRKRLRFSPSLQQPRSSSTKTTIREEVPPTFALPASPVRKASASLEKLRQKQQLRASPVAQALDGVALSGGTTQESLQSPTHSGVVDLTHYDSTGSIEADSVSHGSDSESSAIVRQNSRRIKGVLPASWLRLDQKNAKDMTRKGKPGHRASEQEPKRGVAVPRSARAGGSSDLWDIPISVDDSSDDDDNDDNEHDHAFAPRIELAGSRSNTNSHTPVEMDDGLSVIEDDYIDWMLPGRKSNRPAASRRQGIKKRKSTQRDLFRGTFRNRQHQQKITRMLGQARDNENAVHERPLNDDRRGLSRPQARRSLPGQPISTRTSPPPRLSILDVMDNNAPAFIRIAARTAKRKPTQGKSSPSTKHINLGTRADNLDALSVLHDWKTGRLQPKDSATSLRPRPKSRPKSNRKPLREISPNLVLGSTDVQSRLNFSGARKLGPDAVLGKSPQKAVQEAAERGHTVPTSRRRGGMSVGRQARPALLEVGGPDRQDNLIFTTGKRALDAVYRRSKKGIPELGVNRLERELGNRVTEDIRGNKASSTDEGNRPLLSPRTVPKLAEEKTRYRKRYQPKIVDVDAPQFRHANDPLLQPMSTQAEVETEKRQPLAGTLQGLGPYGMQYTQHFEVFPLSAGVYFHEATLIGSGRLAMAAAAGLQDRLRSRRPHATFKLGDRTLDWGEWNDTVSSELGILIDWIAEHWLQPGPTQLVGGGMSALIDAADFLLNYVLHGLNLPDDQSVRSFAARIVEVARSFRGRLPAIPLQAEDGHQGTGHLLGSLKNRIQVVGRVLVVLLSALQITKASELCAAELGHIHEELAGLSKMYVSDLMRLGHNDLWKLYGDLQQLSCRERGIRNDRLSATGWVVAMRVLGIAQIPRLSFWDVLRSTIPWPPDPGRSVPKMEEIWQLMFCLLPLSEMSNDGVLVAGRRFQEPMEGWGLPQMLLKHVFDAYRTNSRQTASFNEYCRAIVGRCYVLIQQWGWKNCSGIVGTIFDFFGSRSLSHLRNEVVYQSPRFLEELASGPSLSIEPDDRCFHIFIKMLAFLIKRLRNLGLNKDIRNLVARTLPNHDRQYLKEDAVREDDLAALRNHHDLLCTLFWAAPPDLRPGIHVIEKLVAPGRSHKQACIISLRAWSQLARFVVSSREDFRSYRPLLAWQTSIFQQILDQYLQAESDINQQLLALPKETANDIDRGVIDSMISRNKAAALDVLFASLRMSFDVLKHSPSLGVATSTLNSVILEQVFTRFDFSSPQFDWNIPLVALEILEHYLSRVDEALDDQYSSERAEVADSAQTEEAVLLLDHKLAGSFFPMVRRLVGSGEKGTLHGSDTRGRVLEKAVVLSAKLAARFIHSRIIDLSRCFMPGRYGVFEKKVPDVGSPQRTYLPLFVSTLIRSNVFSFSGMGVSVLGLWMAATTKPSVALAYENYMAETLKQHGFPFLQDVFVPAGVTPDYHTDRDYFLSGMSYMRKSLLEAGTTASKQLRDEYASILGSVMQGMKTDLRLLRSDATRQRLYTDFVREIIGLIKSHGVSICTVDQFFTEPSADYSPPSLDPRLHAAGIVAYGIRLREGDNTASPQLFHYLFQNFKVALANDRLDEERAILERALDHQGVLTFFVTQLVPATIQAASRAPNAWPLLDLYCTSLVHFLTRSCAPREINDEAGLKGMLDTVLAGLNLLRQAAEEEGNVAAILVHLHLAKQLMILFNALQPSLTSQILLSPLLSDSDLEPAIHCIAHLAEDARKYLGELLATCETELRPSDIDIRRMFDGLRHSQLPSLRLPPRVEEYARVIVVDVRANWIVSEDRVALRAAPGPASSVRQGGDGAVTYDPWQACQLLESFYQEVQLWTLGTTRSRQPAGSRSSAWEPVSLLSEF